MKIRSFIVDSFTDKPFQGNPAGVCLLESAIEDHIMQSIAAEFNLSETAFVRKSEQKENHYLIRYFTPTVEIDFCGHATLAASKVLLEELPDGYVSFTTHIGLELKAKKDDDSILMNFPLYETDPFTVEDKLLNAFGIEEPVSIRFAAALEMLIVEVEDKASLLNLNPDYAEALKASNDIKELVACASDDQDYDFYSRCFCPWIGINEDPVTGASHSVLAKYWQYKLQKDEFKAFQLSKRGGYMNLKITGSSNLEVRSDATIVFRGSLEL